MFRGRELRAEVFGYDVDSDLQKLAGFESLTISEHQTTKPKPWFEPYLETKDGLKQSKGSVPVLEDMFNTCGGVNSVCKIETEVEQRPSAWHLSCESRPGKEDEKQIGSAEQKDGIQKSKKLILQHLKSVLNCMGSELERWKGFPKKFECQTLDLRNKKAEVNAWRLLKHLQNRKVAARSKDKRMIKL